jgi:anti-sigma B factor antagonist
MRFKTEIRNGMAVVRLAGRFVTGSDADLVCMKDQLEKAGVVKAILDLSGVPYIDSTGLAFVVELHNAMRRRGGQVVLANVNARVREVLAMTRIQEVLPIFDGEDSAEAGLRDAELAAQC